MRPAILLAAVLLAGCAADSVPIRYGKDTCAHCRMAIADTRFGAELVNRNGKAFTFDAIECLAAYLDAHPMEAGGMLWVTDYEHPPRFVRAQTARYVRSARLRSPMGADLAAFAPAASRTDLVRRYGGEALAWADVRKLVRARAAGAGGMPAPPGMPMGGHGAHDAAGGTPAGMPMRAPAHDGPAGAMPGMPGRGSAPGR